MSTDNPSQSIEQELTEALKGVDASESSDSLVPPSVQSDAPAPPTASEDAPPLEPAQPEQLSFLERLKQTGLEVGDDEDAAVQTVTQRLEEAKRAKEQAEQLQQYAQYGQLHLQHAGEFQQWLAEREKQKDQPPPDPNAPPEYDPSWLHQVQRNDAGELVPINGGTPETVAKLQRALEWREQFWRDPRQNLQGFIDQRAEEIAKSMLEKEINKVSERVASQHFVATNRDWLFEANQYNQDGTPKLSEKGSAFAGYLQEGQNAGMSAQQQQDYALRRLADWDRMKQLESQLAELKSTPTPEQQKEKFLADAAGHGPNSDASTNPPPAAAPQDQPPQNENMSLDEQLRAEFKRAGINNETLLSQLQIN